MRAPLRPAYARSVISETAPRRAGTTTRVRDWFDGHVALVDLVLATGLWFFTAIGYAVSGLDVGAGEMLALFVVACLQTLPLAWRRTRPELGFGLVVLGHVGQLVAADSPMPSNLSAPLAAFAVAAHARHDGIRRLGLGVAAISGPLAVWDWSTYDGASSLALVIMSVFFSALAIVCWLWGDLTRKRRELVARLREQNDALRRDRDQRARIATQDERTRIAREMHDVVAHSLSVVVVQADGAAYAAEHGADFDREQAHAALTTIGTTAREALAETRHLVGVLRTTDDEGEAPRLAYAPTEGLADLPDLVERVAASGIDASVELGTGLHAVRREVGLAAYRIVQESLTNVIKHAGPGARARVRVNADDRLHVEVRDDGRGAAAPDDGHGHGLIGMRERAASVGGSVEAGPSPGGGYLVTATLPLRPQETT